MHTRQRTGPAAPSSKPYSPCSLAWPRRLLLLGNEEETMAGTAALCRPRDGDQTNLQGVIRGDRHNAEVGIIMEPARATDGCCNGGGPDPPPAATRGHQAGHDVRRRGRPEMGRQHDP